MLYGLALILMMRFRPEGILPESRIAHEMHPERGYVLSEAICASPQTDNQCRFTQSQQSDHALWRPNSRQGSVVGRLSRGKFFSLIGPNALARRQRFNAITGIYSPNRRNNQLSKISQQFVIGPGERRCSAFIGLFTGLCGFFGGSNIDTLWNTAINRPHNKRQLQLE